jgi:hypothetical protein
MTLPQPCGLIKVFPPQVLEATSLCNNGGKTLLSLSLIAFCKFFISCVWGNELAIIVGKSFLFACGHF